MTDHSEGAGAQATEAIDNSAEEDIELESVAPGLSRELKRLLILLAAGLLIFSLFYFTPIGSIARDIHKLREFLQGDDLYAEMTYAALVAVFVAIGMPRLVFYGLGGVAFGFWEGLLLAQVGSIVGSSITFYAVRHGGRDWLKQKLGNHRFVGKAFHVRSSVKAVVLIRQLPISSIMINTGLALSQVTAQDFLVGTFIGYLPQGAIATLIGSGIVDQKAMDGIGKLVAAAVVLLIGAGFLWQRGKMRKGEAARQPPAGLP